MFTQIKVKCCKHTIPFLIIFEKINIATHWVIDRNVLQNSRLNTSMLKQICVLHMFPLITVTKGTS